MAKKSQKQVVVKKSVQFQLPSLVTIDELAMFEDGQVRARIISLEDEMKAVVDAGLDPTPWEIEICYVQREIGMRIIRSRAHVNFVNAEKTFWDNQARAEQWQDQGDFDNRSFVNLMRLRQ